MNAKNGQNGRNGPNGQNRPDGPAEPDRGEGKAMSSPAAGRVYGQHSGYRNLNKHLIRHGLRQWQEGEPVFTEARNLRPKTLDQPGRSEPIEERAANLGAILATQAHWLTERLLDRQARDFKAGGGFSERLYRARTKKPPGPP
jgi:four helix bundle suffix protein